MTKRLDDKIGRKQQVSVQHSSQGAAPSKYNVSGTPWICTMEQPWGYQAHLFIYIYSLNCWVPKKVPSHVEYIGNFKRIALCLRDQYPSNNPLMAGPLTPREVLSSFHKKRWGPRGLDAWKGKLGNDCAVFECGPSYASNMRLHAWMC